jgi:hypothetical protein
MISPTALKSGDCVFFCALPGINGDFCYTFDEIREKSRPVGQLLLSKDVGRSRQS